MNGSNLNLNAIGAAVRRLRQKQKMTLEQMRDMTGVDTGNLSRIERGAGWSFDTISMIASKGLRIGLAELFTEAERGNGGSHGGVSVTIPVVNLEDLKGGNLKSALRKTVAHTRTTARVSGKAFAFEYRGSSMPEFRNGELIVIDPDVPPAFGAYVLVQASDEVLFRKIDVDGGKTYLYASNKQFPAVALRPKQHTILGVARQAIRDL